MSPGPLPPLHHRAPTGDRRGPGCAPLLAAALLVIAGWTAHAAEGAFAAFLAGLWPEAEAIGVSRAVFDEATAGLEPDGSLPDLVLPGRPDRPSVQPEFVQTPAQYLSPAAIAPLAGQGRSLVARHRDTLEAIEKRFGVPGSLVIAIWGRETGYGIARLPHPALRVLATQAYAGRRKDAFRREFLLALKMVQDGEASPARMRSSWAGAMGQGQMLPSQFLRFAVDFDGDGRRDIWTSVPDALASIANQLAGQGWHTGRPWAVEVAVPAGLDCTLADPDRKLPWAEWLRRGVVPARGGPPDVAAGAEDVSLLQPAGPHSPAFLIGPNYFVLKEYNFSDLYVLFVGHLADRIAGGPPFATPWSRVAQATGAEIEAMQRHLATRGLYTDKIDGKAGMRTRLAVGRYQKANGLTADCWPSAAVLAHMRGTGG